MNTCLDVTRIFRALCEKLQSMVHASKVVLARFVVAVGNGKVLEDGSTQPLDVKKGDRLLFGKYAGTEVPLEDGDHIIIREDDVLGIVE